MLAFDSLTTSRLFSGSLMRDWESWEKQINASTDVVKHDSSPRPVITRRTEFLWIDSRQIAIELHRERKHRKNAKNVVSNFFFLSFYGAARSSNFRNVSSVICGGIIKIWAWEKVVWGEQRWAARMFGCFRGAVATELYRRIAEHNLWHSRDCPASRQPLDNEWH